MHGLRLGLPPFVESLSKLCREVRALYAKWVGAEELLCLLLRTLSREKGQTVGRGLELSASPWGTDSPTDRVDHSHCSLQ